MNYTTEEYFFWIGVEDGAKKTLDKSRARPWLKGNKAAIRYADAYLNGYIIGRTIGQKEVDKFKPLKERVKLRKDKNKPKINTQTGVFWNRGNGEILTNRIYFV